MRRTLVAVIALAGVFVPSASARTGLAWAPCAGAPVQECATLQVPLDYQKEGGGQQISLAVSRIRTAKPEARRGVLLLIPGGPGSSGLYRPSTHGLRLPREVLDRYDIVGFDPRGVGQSTPVDCKFSPQDADPVGFQPWPGPGGDISANVAKASRIAQTCVDNSGSMMRHMNTRNAARDLDQVRRALGERKVSYWGVSYGTYVGAVYATMFPHRTDRVVLDSSGDPNPERVARGWMNNFAVGVEDRFPDFAAWVVNNAPDLGSTPAAVRENYLKLSADNDFVRASTFNGLYNNANFPLLAEVLRAAQNGSPMPPVPVPPADQFKNLLAVQTAIGCNDVAWPRSVDFYARNVAQNRVDFPLTAGMPANIQPCAFWPYPPREEATRIKPTPNVLLVQNLRDPATPYSGALKMRAALRAPMVSIDAGGHGAYLSNPCGDAAVTRFLTDGTAQETRC